MGWSDLLENNASIIKAIDLIGDRWSLMVLSCCFCGVCRFNQFESFLSINRNLLSARLDKLVDAGLLKRHLYNENPPRYEYQLTEIARELRPVIIGLTAWAERHFTKEEAQFSVVHKECERKIDTVIYCETCDARVHKNDIATKINPCAGPNALRIFESIPPEYKITN